MTNIEINREPVELYKLLKLEGLAQSGGEAKHFIDSEMVKLNGAIETRKRKKVYSGDVVSIHDQEFEVVLTPTS